MRIPILGLLLLWLVSSLGCSHPDYPSRPITIICPWAAGGGTDRVSRQMALLLERELGVPVNVINATGGKGVTGHNRGLSARPDGYTLTMITLELNMMHFSGLTDLTYRDCIPLVSLNEDYAALMVRMDSPWQSLNDLELDVGKNPQKFTASGTAAGGAWHLAVAGWLLAAGRQADDVVWIPSEGAGPSLQQLLSGGVDLVCCSLPEARSLLESNEIRALGVMSPQRALGFEAVPTFAEQGRNWSLGGWRALAVPVGTPPEIVDRLTNSLVKITTDKLSKDSFQQFMASQKFDSTTRAGADLNSFLAETDRKLGELLTSQAMQSVRVDRFSPMVYPNIVLGLMFITALAILVQKKPSSAISMQEQSTPILPNRTNFLFVILAAILYSLVAETVGFVIAAGTMLLALLWRLGVSLPYALLLVLLAIPITNTVFSTFLRVTLPQGWLGW
ncbi:MAG: tripartite tricarboxylate transporter TctB family protein [Planctomycetales bacterium]|nr:tripartite tricarboxylate transporter TctB family protein [Planctomycetales bacterium]